MYRTYRVMGLMAVVMVLFATTAGAVTRSVPGSYPTIQAAIDAASAGDTVSVQPGQYMENITLKSGVNLQGSGPDSCVIQGTGGYSTVFANGLSQSTTVSGFTITGGQGTAISWSAGRIMGGGVFADNSVLTLANNRIISNGAQIGGGIAAMNSQVTIVGNDIRQNHADTAVASAINMGGGIYLYDSQGQISANTIAQNLVSSGALNPNLVDSNGNQAPGGGICVVFSKTVGALTISDNTIEANTATGAQFYGGGLYLYQASTSLTNAISVTGNTFSQNQGLDGGGMAVIQCSPTVTGNTFSDNQGHWGGGIYGYMGQGSITGNTFSDNRAVTIRTGVFTGGGGLLCDQGYTPTVSGNVFSANQAVDYGGGLEVYKTSAQTIDGNLFSDNSARLGGGIVVEAATPTIARNCLTGNTASQSGGGIFMENAESVSLYNNLIVGNTASMFGGGIVAVNQANPLCVNNTVVGNTADWWGGGIYGYNSSFSVIGCIVSGNTNFGIAADTATNITTAYDDVWGNSQGDYYQTSAGVGCLSADPGFLNVTGYQLDARSPCINAGPPNSTDNDPDGSRNDMGAYGGPTAGSIPLPGFTPPATLPAAPVMTVGVSGVTVTFSWTSVPGAGGYLFGFRPATGGAYQYIDVGTLTGAPVPLYHGAAFCVEVQAYNAAGNSAPSNIPCFNVP